MNDEIETDEYVRMTFKFSKKGRQVFVRSDQSRIDDKNCDPEYSGGRIGQ